MTSNDDHLKLLHLGSVKDIYQHSSPDQLLFRFSDRYSIFDWGEMPDAIPEKGKALADMGHQFLSYFNSIGIPTHYIGRGPLPTDLIVKSVAVPRGDLQSIQAAYTKKPIDTLVPLEVIYRFGVPKGSSLLRKFKTENDWKAAGFDRAYQEGEDFSFVKFDVTTKLEKLDRPLSATEAQTLAGLSEQEWNKLLLFTKSIALELQAVFAKTGIKLWDGKLEFAFIQGQEKGSRDFMLVDSIGLDEIRLTFDGKTLSKELLRQYYITTPWYEALNQAKSTAPDDFKNFCMEKLNEKPIKLPAAVLKHLSSVYTLAGKMIFENSQIKLELLKVNLSKALEQLT